MRREVGNLHVLVGGWRFFDLYVLGVLCGLLCLYYIYPHQLLSNTRAACFFTAIDVKLCLVTEIYTSLHYVPSL